MPIFFKRIYSEDQQIVDPEFLQLLELHLNKANPPLVKNCGINILITLVKQVRYSENNDDQLQKFIELMLESIYTLSQDVLKSNPQKPVEYENLNKLFIALAEFSE